MRTRILTSLAAYAIWLGGYCRTWATDETNAPVNPSMHAEWKGGDMDFGARYDRELARRSEQAYADRLASPAGQLSLVSAEVTLPTFELQSYVMKTVGVGIFRTALGDSFRETLARDTIDIEWPTSPKTQIGRFFEGMLEGSVGNADEEHIRPVSPSLSYAESENRTDLEDSGPGLSSRYGLRPWRSDPYAYTEFGIGHVAGHQVFVDLRARTFLEPARVGHYEYEAAMSVSLTHGLHLSAGTAIAPANEPHTWMPAISGRIEYVTGLNGPAWYTGFETGARQTTTYVAGWTVPW